MGRPKLKNKKVKLSITIDKELNDRLVKNNPNKSKYIEGLISDDFKLLDDISKIFNHD